VSAVRLLCRNHGRKLALWLSRMGDILVLHKPARGERSRLPPVVDDALKDVAPPQVGSKTVVADKRKRKRRKGFLTKNLVPAMRA